MVIRPFRKLYRCTSETALIFLAGVIMKRIAVNQGSWNPGVGGEQEKAGGWREVVTRMGK